MTRTEQQRFAVCTRCFVYDDRLRLFSVGLPSDEARNCPRCGGSMQECDDLYRCDLCNRVMIAKLIKCVGCLQLGVNLTCCDECMNVNHHHHIDCPVWRNRKPTP